MLSANHYSTNDICHNCHADLYSINKTEKHQKILTTEFVRQSIFSALFARYLKLVPSNHERANRPSFRYFHRHR